MKALTVSPISATFELEGNDVYYAKEKFDVYLNNEVVLHDITTNVFSLYDLHPNKRYTVRVNDQVVFITTKAITNTIDLSRLANLDKDVSKDIQEKIDNAVDNTLFIFGEGTYNITSISLRSNCTYYLKEGAILSASTNINDYEAIKGTYEKDGVIYQRGSFEGLPHKQRKSIIDVFECENIYFIGKGKVVGNASKSEWWQTQVKAEITRPHMLFINQSTNIRIQGVSFEDSPFWTIHGYYSEHLGFYDFSITNDVNGPNTDGIDPQCCAHVSIMGVVISVGDDCISIKSGKLGLAEQSFKKAEYFYIRNCLLKEGHGAIVLGSEMACGISSLHIHRCLFVRTDRGLRIKTRRGRGDKAIIDGVRFKNIKMDNVLTPITMNMFYFCDPDGKEKYVWDKEALPVDERTPFLGNFIFEDLECKNVEYCAGFFYGLPEMPIESVTITNSTFEFKETAGKGYPAMMSFIDEYSKSGFVFNNIRTVYLHNVTMEGQDGEKLTTSGVNRTIEF